MPIDADDNATYINKLNCKHAMDVYARAAC